MSKFIPLFLFLFSALLLIFLCPPTSAQGRPPPGKSGRPTQHGRVTTDGEEKDGTAEGGATDAESGEKEEPGLSQKLLNVLLNHLSSHLPKISTESVVNWVQETFGLDRQTSRNYVRKAQEIKRHRGDD
ncbi:hypothetical protein niasHT_035310 [Heterodera trifolii]|uniref:Uncharacterized protein n=1 Tax=Heterodera trifolii TaxID=157864 RepID=A0ABD2HXH4_9BILA